MKVFIAGATGVLGRRLVRQFRERGHGAVGLVRSAEGEQTVRSLEGEPRRGDLFDSDSLARAAEGCDVVIHAATAIPTRPRTGPADWAMNDRIRREGTRALARAAGMAGARIYLQQSIVWVARPPDGSSFDESCPVQPHPLYNSAAEGEQIAREAGARQGFQVMVLRFGGFYSADAAHSRMLAEGLARRRLPIVGSGGAVMALIHSDDAAGAFVSAAEAGHAGLWHVVDDYPVSVAELLRTLAQKLCAPTPRRVPVWLARLVAGKTAVEYFTTSTRTSNQKFKDEVGWKPRFPTIREGLEEVVAAWRAVGFLGAAGGCTAAVIPRASTDGSLPR
jgi:nucleoside-diphosphate-sugar epimerase